MKNATNHNSKCREISWHLKDNFELGQLVDKNYIKLFLFVKLTFEMLAVHRQHPSFTTDELIFLRKISHINSIRSNHQGPLLLTWFNFSPSMDK